MMRTVRSFHYEYEGIGSAVMGITHPIVSDIAVNVRLSFYYIINNAIFQYFPTIPSALQGTLP